MKTKDLLIAAITKHSLLTAERDAYVALFLESLPITGLIADSLLEIRRLHALHELAKYIADNK